MAWEMMYRCCITSRVSSKVDGADPFGPTKATVMYRLMFTASPACLSSGDSRSQLDRWTALTGLGPAILPRWGRREGMVRVSPCSSALMTCEWVVEDRQR
jgi:hypothetical protein